MFDISKHYLARTNFSHYWRKIFLSILFIVFWSIRFSTLTSRKRNFFQPWVTYRYCFFLFFGVVIILTSVVFLHTYGLISMHIQLKTWVGPSAHFWSNLHSVFFFLILCFLNSSCFGFPHFFSVQEHFQAAPEFSISVLWFFKFSPGSRLVNASAHLICFLAFRDHWPLLYDVQCFKNHCFTYCVQHFSCFGREDK